MPTANATTTRCYRLLRHGHRRARGVVTRRGIIAKGVRGLADVMVAVSPLAGRLLVFRLLAARRPGALPQAVLLAELSLESVAAVVRGAILGGSRLKLHRRGRRVSLLGEARGSGPLPRRLPSGRCSLRSRKLRLRAVIGRLGTVSGVVRVITRIRTCRNDADPPLQFETVAENGRALLAHPLRRSRPLAQARGSRLRRPLQLRPHV